MGNLHQRSAPINPIKRSAPIYPIKQSAPINPIKRSAPIYPIKRSAPINPIKRSVTHLSQPLPPSISEIKFLVRSHKMCRRCAAITANNFLSEGLQMWP